MPESAKAANSIGRFTIGFNVVVQLLLGVFLFGVVNYLSWRSYKRWDLTDHKTHTLSDTTISFLESMEKPVDMIVLFTRGTQLTNNVYSLVDEFKRHAGQRLNVEYIDPVREPNKLENLKSQLQLELVDRKDGIILKVREDDSARPRTKFLMEDDFVIMNAETGRIGAFIGETALTSGLLNIIEDKKPVIGLVTGKGSPNEGARGETARLFLNRFAAEQNATIEPLDIVDPAVPLSRADVIVILNIKADFHPEEIERLKQYWESKRGSLFVMLNPKSHTPNFIGFLEHYGVHVQNDRVMRVLHPPQGPVIDWSVSASFNRYPVVTKHLSAIKTRFSGMTQSLSTVQSEESNLKQRGITIASLISAEESYWGETRIHPGGEPAGRAQIRSRRGHPPGGPMSQWPWRWAPSMTPPFVSTARG